MPEAYVIFLVLRPCWMAKKCYRFLLQDVYSFHFEMKKLRFKAKALKEISFLTETTSIHFFMNYGR